MTVTVHEIQTHVHREIIMQYLNGAKIQYSHDRCTWEDTVAPSFGYDIYYRIKPKTVKGAVVEPYADKLCSVLETDDYYSSWTTEYKVVAMFEVELP